MKLISKSQKDGELRAAVRLEKYEAQLLLASSKETCQQLFRLAGCAAAAFPVYHLERQGNQWTAYVYQKPRKEKET